MSSVANEIDEAAVLITTEAVEVNSFSRNVKEASWLSLDGCALSFAMSELNFSNEIDGSNGYTCHGTNRKTLGLLITSFTRTNSFR
jgi:hypothetical protein